MYDNKFHHIVSFNGNLYIDGSFQSGQYAEFEAKLAFDLFFEKTVREVIEEVTGKEVMMV